MVKETNTLYLENEIISTITEIRSKDEKRPCSTIIMTKFAKKKLTHKSYDVEDALMRLAQQKRFENRGEASKESYFVLDFHDSHEATKQKVNNKTEDVICLDEPIKYTPLLDFMALKHEAESSVKATHNDKKTWICK